MLSDSENRNIYRVALLVDNPQRDLPGLCLVARKLAREGACCFLVPMNLRVSEVWALAPDFVLINHFRTIYENWVRELFASNINVGVLDTEGNVFGSVPSNATAKENKDLQRHNELNNPYEEYAISMVRDKETRSKIKCFCSWSSSFADYANKSGWYLDKQLFVTGTPRTDFYSKDWQTAALKLAPEIDLKEKKLILVNTNFTLANPRFATPEKEVENLKSWFSFNEEYLNYFHDSQAYALKGLIKIIKRLSKVFPMSIIVCRPHPFEKDEIYSKSFKKISNVIIGRHGTVDGWLLKSKLLLHWGSSTSIEASILQIPSFSLDWLPLPIPIPYVEDTSHKCHSEEDLLRKVSDVLNNDYVTPNELLQNRTRIISSTYHKIDGKAHERVAKTLLNNLKTNKNKPNIKFCKETFNPTIQQTHKIPWDHSEKYFDKIKIIEIMDAIEKSDKNKTLDFIKDLKIEYSNVNGDYLTQFPNGRSISISV